jgi:hypothetical protein
MAHSLKFRGVLINHPIYLIFHLLENNESELLKPLLKIIGKIDSGTDNRTNALISLGILTKSWNSWEVPFCKSAKKCFLYSAISWQHWRQRFEGRGKWLDDANLGKHFEFWTPYKKYAILGLCNWLTRNREKFSIAWKKLTSSFTWSIFSSPKKRRFIWIFKSSA